MAGKEWADDLVARLRELHAQGMSDRELAGALGVENYRTTRKRYLLGLKPNPPKLPPSKGYGGRKSTEVAHAENDQPWEPLPGMLKLRCLKCHYWFASPGREIRTCPDCRGA